MYFSRFVDGWPVATLEVLGMTLGASALDKPQSKRGGSDMMMGAPAWAAKRNSSIRAGQTGKCKTAPPDGDSVSDGRDDGDSLVVVGATGTCNKETLRLSSKTPSYSGQNMSEKKHIRNFQYLFLSLSYQYKQNMT